MQYSESGAGALQFHPINGPGGCHCPPTNCDAKPQTTTQQWIPKVFTQTHFKPFENIRITNAHNNIETLPPVGINLFVGSTVLVLKAFLVSNWAVSNVRILLKDQLQTFPLDRQHLHLGSNGCSDPLCLLKNAGAHSCPHAQCKLLTYLKLPTKPQSSISSCRF